MTAAKQGKDSDWFTDQWYAFRRASFHEADWCTQSTFRRPSSFLFHQTLFCTFSI